MFSKVMEKAKSAKKGIGSDIKVIKAIKQSMVMLMVKFRQEAAELEMKLKDDLSKYLHAQTDTLINRLKGLQDAIAMDMKRWKHQRADLQIEINKVDEKITGKKDQGLAILNEEANQFDVAFGQNQPDENQYSRAYMSMNTHADSNYPPTIASNSFLTMMEKQSQMIRAGAMVKPNTAQSPFPHNFFHQRPSSHDVTSQEELKPPSRKSSDYQKAVDKNRRNTRTAVEKDNSSSFKKQSNR